MKKRYMAILVALAIAFGGLVLYLDHREKTKYDNETIHVTSEDDEKYPTTNSKSDYTFSDESSEKDSSSSSSSNESILDQTYDDIIDNKSVTPILQKSSRYSLISSPDILEYVKNPRKIVNFLNDVHDDVSYAVKNRIVVYDPETNSVSGGNSNTTKNPSLYDYYFGNDDSSDGKNNSSGNKNDSSKSNNHKKFILVEPEDDDKSTGDDDHKAQDDTSKPGDSKSDDKSSSSKNNSSDNKSSKNDSSNKNNSSNGNSSSGGSSSGGSSSGGNSSEDSSNGDKPAFKTPKELVDKSISILNDIDGGIISINVSKSNSTINKVIKTSPNKQYISVTDNKNNSEEVYLIKDSGSIKRYTNESGYWTISSEGSFDVNFKKIFINGSTNDMKINKIGTGYTIVQPCSQLNSSIVNEINSISGDSVNNWSGNVTYTFDRKGTPTSISISKGSTKINIYYSNLNSLSDSDIVIPNTVVSSAIEKVTTVDNSANDINVTLDGTRLNLYNPVSLPSGWTKDSKYNSAGLSIYYKSNLPLYVYTNNSRMTGFNATVLEDGSCPSISINGFTLNSSKTTMFNVFGNAKPTSVLDNVYETYTYTINGASHTYTIELVNDASTDTIKEMTLTSN